MRTQISSSFITGGYSCVDEEAIIASNSVIRILSQTCKSASDEVLSASSLMGSISEIVSYIV